MAMKIIHYILGFPPKRSGGLTKYAIDLMQAEKKLGHRVCAVFPGNRFPIAQKMGIKSTKSYKGIPCWKIKNALPVPLLCGIQRANDFQSLETDGCEIFNTFFSENQFDVLHVHTLMGLPISFLMSAKKNGVKIVFTSHDYFGLCPRVNFVDSCGRVCDGSSPDKCASCNRRAKSVWYLWFRNSWLLIVLKKLFK